MKLLKDLITELHGLYFKPNGFRKRRQRFWREYDNVMQEIEFQSSQWNSEGDPNTFYVNIHIGFSDIPMKDGKPALTGMGRISGLVPEAPSQYDLTSTNYPNIRDQLVKFLPRAMKQVEMHYEDVRNRAKNGLRTPMPLPETWRAEQTNSPIAKGAGHD
jgi:hypothetical protein